MVRLPSSTAAAILGARSETLERRPGRRKKLVKTLSGVCRRIPHDRVKPAREKKRDEPTADQSRTEADDPADAIGPADGVPMLIGPLDIRTLHKAIVSA
ncbi:hypothetical protein BKD09_41980 [Bradyrhizobium japonicum]|uniref:Uncharacterized protein n=1 Tax=Bradyrhizobium japonicum TaxID=375 RepID=A0A1L3FNK5_BRAJP|nr:hypothetical protein BKD09_41980 [Bradyrhizobium japonicum]